MTTTEKNTPKLRFPDFNGVWKLGELSQVLKLQSGFAFSSDLFAKAGTKLVTPKNFTKFGFGNFNLKFTKYTTEAVPQKYVCSEGDLLVLLTDLTPSCELLGKPLELKKEDGKVLLNQRIARLETDRKAINSGFLRSFLLTNKFHKRIVRTASGTTVRHSSNKILNQTPVWLPTLQEQQKIAAFLSSADTKIEQLGKKKALLEQYKKGVMQKLFSQALRFKDEQGNNFPDWEEKKLGDFCESLSGCPVAGDDIREEDTGIPLLRGINITEGVVRHSSNMDRFHGGKINSGEKFLLKEGDVVIGMDGSKVGKNIATITKRDAGSFLIQRVTRLRKKASNSVRYVYFHIISDRFRRYVDTVNTSSGIPHISVEQINEFSISMPHPDEQQKIASFLSTINKKIELVSAELEKAQTFKKGLLQQMFI